MAAAAFNRKSSAGLNQNGVVTVPLMLRRERLDGLTETIFISF
jgi:hypothetical protein